MHYTILFVNIYLARKITEIQFHNILCCEMNISGWFSYDLFGNLRNSCCFRWFYLTTFILQEEDEKAYIISQQ